MSPLKYDPSISFDIDFTMSLPQKQMLLRNSFRFNKLFLSSVLGCASGWLSAAIMYLATKYAQDSNFQNSFVFAKGKAASELKDKREEEKQNKNVLQKMVSRETSTVDALALT